MNDEKHWLDNYTPDKHIELMSSILPRTWDEWKQTYTFIPPETITDYPCLELTPSLLTYLDSKIKDAIHKTG